MKAVFLASLPLLSACASIPAGTPEAPAVDYHQHLVSPAFARVAKVPERDGQAVLRELDAAGIRKAVVLSVGYSLADERKKLADPDRLTREENDWTSAQVAAAHGRLIGFCSANPLRDAAMAELQRCLRLPGMRGIKQHFGNSGVSLRNPDHLARIKGLFLFAQRLRAPVLIHMRARGGQNYGAEDARILLADLMPLAPNIDVVIAHLGSAGPGYAEADPIMAVFGSGPRPRNLYVDVATNVTAETTPEEAALIASRLRAVGIDRVLYGSDLTPPGGSVQSGWEIFRSKLPLTAAEFRTIARNVRPFAR